MTLPEHAAGNIYDLGYRGYDGRRLGRPYAVYSLFAHSVRTAFGLGRRPSAKVLPIGLAAIALIPAAIQLAIASVANNIVEIYRAEDYYGYVQVVLALFCAAVAPELVCRDQRNHTLALYFSRSLKRHDYALAKLAALAAALLLLTVGPQAVLFVGNGLAGNDLDGYLRDNAWLLPRIVITAMAVSFFMASIGLVIAAQTSRRAFAAAGIVAAFVVPAPVTAILLEALEDTGWGAVVYISPFHVMQGMTRWLFGVDLGVDLGRAGQPGWGYFAVTGAVGLAAAGFAVRRYQRLAA